MPMHLILKDSPILDKVLDLEKLNTTIVGQSKRSDYNGTGAHQVCSYHQQPKVRRAAEARTYIELHFCRSNYHPWSG